MTRWALVLAALLSCASNVSDPPPRCESAGTFSTGFACAEWCLVPEGYNFGTCEEPGAWRRCVTLDAGDYSPITRSEGARELTSDDFRIRRVCP